jgi:radical SAM protein with 4Fe4S-binding SPASM domain
MLSQNSSFISVNALAQSSIPELEQKASPVLNDHENVLFAPGTPTTYTFELTSHCNERCPGCGNNELFSRHHPYLSGTEWIELLERVRPYARYVRLTGGECTLHPDFEAIVSHLDAFDIPYAIFTNGVWQKPGELIDFFSRLKNLSALLISLHGPDAETHNTFTGTRFFERSIENIRRATTAGITVDTNTVFMRCNWQKIESIVRLSNSLGARCAVFSRYYGAALPIVDLTDSELAEAVQNVDRLRAVGYPTKVNPCIPECFIASSSGGCGAGVTLCTVDPMGNVRPCNHAPLFMGNLRQMEMPDIWASSEAFRWRSLIPEGCTSCSALSRCRGGCRATALHRKLDADPLMRGPLTEAPPASRRVYAGLRPIGQFDVRAESDGALLVRFNHVISVTSQGAVVAQAMDGNITLADLNSHYGQEALQLALELYEQGLVEFAE